MLEVKAQLPLGVKVALLLRNIKRRGMGMSSLEKLIPKPLGIRGNNQGFRPGRSFVSRTNHLRGRPCNARNHPF